MISGISSDNTLCAIVSFRMSILIHALTSMVVYLNAIEIMTWIRRLQNTLCHIGIYGLFVGNKTSCFMILGCNIISMHDTMMSYVTNNGFTNVGESLSSKFRKLNNTLHMPIPFKHTITYIIAAFLVIKINSF